MPACDVETLPSILAQLQSCVCYDNVLIKVAILWELSPFQQDDIAGASVAGPDRDLFSLLYKGSLAHENH